MSVSKDELKYIASLAKLDVKESDLEEYTADLSKILEYVKKLDEADTEGIEPMFHPFEIKNHLRDDIRKESLPRETAMKNAPSTDADNEYFKVPKVISGK
ncbi:MAG: Asp-tRNA(Asn)/Glu-tRNA(Gln) amidotransferase subunit GatC [Leptospiraceae bacterium]|nr:Asp-tRNA(Asn)/Glu-tRNA(Gln) amidotransferase subunit GatC [Leptospiraceae bacterium]